MNGVTSSMETSCDAPPTLRTEASKFSASPTSALATRAASEGSFSGSSSVTPEVRTAIPFMDLSCSSMPQNLVGFGRDRAKSESGKDNIFALILGNRAQSSPKNTSAKRVESLKKSLIKLGSLGKDHASGKGKNSKRDKRSNSDGDKLPLFLKRTGSDGNGGPLSLAQPNLQNQKSPESRLSGRFVTTPLPSCQTDISHPLAVEDPEKLEQFSKQKLNTIQKMYEQAVRECEELKHEYQKKPTEMVHSSLEAKVKVVRRLESQLSMYGVESDTPSGEKRICRRGSSIESSLPASDGGDRDVSARPPPMPACSAKNKANEAGGAKMNKAKQEVHLTRSHSDSYKGFRKETDGDRSWFAASTDEIQKFTHGDNSFDHPKSQDATSNESSDSALNRFGPTSDLPSFTPISAEAFDGSKQQSDIIALDDYEFNGSDDENPNQYEDIGSPFNDFTVLKNRPAHLAVFLKFLISNSDARPLLFYLMSGQNYSTGTIKELRKWAYEIFSTFLVDNAPLEVKVDESYIEAINDTLLNKFDKEDAMRTLFLPVREEIVLPRIRELLSDYRSKRALGLGGIYGESELREVLDRNGELKVVDNVLWKDFEQAASDDDCERRQVFASVLATYFKQIGCTNIRNAHLLERCSTFNAKDKSRFSVFGKGAKREKVLTHRSHNLLPQHYYVVTNCSFCQSVLFGVGSQGYQCQKCDLNFHKSCIDKIKNPCSGKKSKPPNMFDKFINKKPSSSEEPVEDDLALVMESRMERTTSMPSIRDVGKTALSYKPSFAGLNFWEKARGHKDSSSRGSDKSDSFKSTEDAKPFAPQTDTVTSDVLPNEEPQNDAAEIAKSPAPSYTSSLVFSVTPYSSTPLDAPSSYSFVQISGDPDLEVEQDLPPLEEIIPKEQLRKLDKKEKKRQEVINELFYTEKTHLRDLKVMKLLFYLPMLQEPSLSDLANLVFPNIDEIVEFHNNLSKEFQQIRNASSDHIVGDFAEILVTYFSDEKGENFKRVCGQFCERQSQAQEQLKSQQRKDPKLVALLQAAASNPYCRRLTLKDFLPIPMQRLTKYPLLIENLIKHTPAESEEYSRLQTALRCSREILSFVNKTVSEYQNRLKLAEIEKKLDARQIENSVDPLFKEYKNLDLSNHVLLHDGLLLWRIRRDRVIPVHVVLLDSILLLLQKQDDRLVLRCEHTLITAAGKDDKRKLTHSPIIKLTNVLVRPVATDKCAFFLIVSTDSSSQIYDLIASSREEKNRWCKHINNVVETIVGPKGPYFPVLHIPEQPTHRATESESSSQVISDLDRKHEGLDAIYDEDEDGADESAKQHTTSRQRIEDETSEVPESDALIVENTNDSDHSVDPIEQLKRIDDGIRRKMCERMKIWSMLWHDSDAVDDNSELHKDPSIRKHLFQMLLETNQMMCLVNNQCTVAGSESGNETGPVCSTALHDSSPSESSTDKTLHEGDETISTMEGFQPGSQMSFPILQIVELNNSINRHLMHLLDSFIRSDEERQKLLVDLQLAQEKLSFLELSEAHGQPTERSSDQTLEPKSEIAEDSDGKTDLPVESDPKLLDSEHVIDNASNAKRFDSTAITDDNNVDRETDVAVDVSSSVASDFPDVAGCSDA